ncbi:MAG: addiction module antidote protein, HigA family [Lentisphaerae bacterium GWF2_44_16]|nr:MAG: addiction module antidote protein, HigA family [Lentisphaerae bacterium GWF2_44_16]
MRTPINIHPGEILLEEFLQPMNISQNRLSIEIRVPVHRINEIVHGRRGLTADTALRLAKFFGTTAAFWMNLQEEYDLRKAEYSIKKELSKITRFEFSQSLA